MEQPNKKHAPPTMSEFGRSIDEALCTIRADIDELKKAAAEGVEGIRNLKRAGEDIRQMGNRMTVAVNAVGGMQRFFGSDGAALSLNQGGSYIFAPADVDERFHFTLHADELLYSDPSRMAIVAAVYMSKRYDVLNTISAILGYAGLLLRYSEMEGDQVEKIERMIRTLQQEGELLESAVSTCRAVFDTSLPGEERRQRYVDTMEIDFRRDARRASENSEFVLGVEKLIDKSEFADRLHSIAQVDPDTFIRIRAVLLCTNNAIVSRIATEDPDAEVRVAAAEVLKKKRAA